MMIQSVRKAMLLLEILANTDGQPLQLSEIADRAGIPKTTCAHLLKALAENSYVEKISRKEGYQIGYGIFFLSRFGGYKHPLASVTHPILQWLAAHTCGTPFVTILRENKRIRIDYCPGATELIHYESPIMVEDALSGVSGKVIMAYMKPNQWIDFSKNLSTDMEILEEELKAIRKNGYAEHTIVRPEGDYRGIAFPFFQGNSQDCIASLCLVYYGEKNTKYINAVRSAANELCRRLAFEGETKLC